MPARLSCRLPGVYPDIGPGARLYEPPHIRGRVGGKVNFDAGQQGNVLRVTDPRSGGAFWRWGAVARCARLLAMAFVCLASLRTPAQTAYFADGYHGGVYGHYPPSFTQYIVDSLRTHPAWKLNLEIEPETWDFVQTNTPEAYQAFKEFADDQSTNARLEFVDPAYAQSYLWNISGESVIQQFARGTQKIREHFPHTTFTTYSSEEPCFTSALPGLLKSFGFKAAVLKNPNTCWGGYTRPFGGELVNWIGPDGTSMPTVPRYGIEQLRPGSTWETMANANSPEFIKAALDAHIAHPIGMCYQDAGWRFGPWLDHVGKVYQPTESILWRNYFENIATQSDTPNWHFSQEDVQVSLVWGAQVLQRIAQEVRSGENRAVMAEKMAALAGVFQKTPWPGATLAEAWRTLLLAQHHDCWIVPYNRRDNQTWADKVARWTAATRERSDDVLDQAMTALMPATTNGNHFFVRVFNTLGNARAELVTATLPDAWSRDLVTIRDAKGRGIPAQMVSDDGNGPKKIMFRANVPSLGFSTYRLTQDHGNSQTKPAAATETGGLVTLETDLYKLSLDPQRGGTIHSLIAKKLGGRELVDTANARRFNEIRGYFFKRGQFLSTADQPAKIDVLEQGPLRFQVRVSSQLGSNVVTQIITLVDGEPRIDFSVRIDWRDNPGIGDDFHQSGDFQATQDRKAFYDDRFKLLAWFPLRLSHQEIFKDAPFDVTESQLTNTFFQNWSAIKNNVILNWVDVFDPIQGIGTALLTDHTTSYAHGADYPLGLTLQYSGVGLWGRNYTLEGATEVHYALLPHRGNWQQCRLWTTSKSWNEPLIAKVFPSVDGAVATDKSLIKIEAGDWEIPTVRCAAGKIFVRLFNPTAGAARRVIDFGGPVSQVELVQLNGNILNEIPFHKEPSGGVVFDTTLPAFGIGTLCITP